MRASVALAVALLLAAAGAAAAGAPFAPPAADAIPTGPLGDAIWWLSKDVPTGVSVTGRGFKSIEAPRPADPVKGRTLYTEKCAACHGASGQGVTGAGGQVVFPALWGSRSFNIGAGMVRLDTAAAFVKAKMRLGGVALTDQEAYDVAAYFTRQPRPDFKAKKGDWPNGDKPKDARY